MKKELSAAVFAACSLALSAAPQAVEDYPLVPLPAAVSFADGRLYAPFSVQTVEDASIPAEGYRLSVDAQGVKIAHSGAAGLAYAKTTMDQLVRSDGGRAWLPCVEISDSPRFRWRGIHWDDCRHFLGKEALMKTLDVMAYHKLNVLHWHLTEDQGWRIEIKKYPELVRKGAVRHGSPKPAVLKSKEAKGQWEDNHIQYGPYFYTQEDIREIVAYAAARNITIVPEIELPGHALAAISAYPGLGCTGEQLEPWWRWGVSEHIFCGGNPETVKFLEDVLDEVCALFPGKYIHIGGDEAPKKMWKTCPKCQAFIKENGLSGEEGLQGWLTKHFTQYLAAKGRRAVGWDEVLDGDPGKDTVVMSWRGAEGGMKAASRGNEVVMSPIDPCYLDQTQGLPCDPHEYINYGIVVSLERCYGFDPAAGIPAERQGSILGGQTNNWSEYTWNGSDAEWKIWPRASAIAECLWTPKERKDWPSFRKRVSALRAAIVPRFYVNAAPVQ